MSRDAASNGSGRARRRNLNSDRTRRCLEVQESAVNGNQRRRGPSDKQRTILRLLAEADRPMRSADLQRRAGLLTGEFRGAVYWLRDNGYIVCTIRKIRTFGIGLAKNKKAFWSILPKGREELLESSAPCRPPHAGEGKNCATPE